MKKIIYIFGLMIFLVGCDSITAKGRYGSIQLNENSNYKSNYKSKKSNGNAFGHKKHHSNGGSNDTIILF